MLTYVGKRWAYRLFTVSATDCRCEAGPRIELAFGLCWEGRCQRHLCNCDAVHDEHGPLASTNSLLTTEYNKAGSERSDDGGKHGDRRRALCLAIGEIDE